MHSCREISKTCRHLELILWNDETTKFRTHVENQWICLLHSKETSEQIWYPFHPADGSGIHSQANSWTSLWSFSYFLTIAQPSVEKKSEPTLKTSLGSFTETAEAHQGWLEESTPQSYSFPLVLWTKEGERKQALWSIQTHSLSVPQRWKRDLFSYAFKQINTRKCCQPLACRMLAHAVG